MENRIKFEIDRKPTDEESAAIDIVKKLQENNFEAYYAGGAVRDLLLNLDPHDIDIATSAKPEEIEKIFAKTYDKGKAFGVICVRSCDLDFEVATFRSDIGTTDHRRPEKIEFTSAQNDATRRDLTINGLFYDPIKKEIIDFVDGIRDIKRKIIRFIGNPQERIDEDYLRMLRAVRFAAKYDFKIDKESQKAIEENIEQINKISTERIRDEFSKIITQRNRVEGIKLLENLGLLKQILPEIIDTKNVPQPKEFHSEGDVWSHIMLALKNIDAPSGVSEELAWAVLLHDIAKPETLGYRNVTGKTSITFFDHDARGAQLAQEILSRFKFSNQFIENVSWAINQHMRIVNAFRGMSERKQKKLFCDPNVQLLLDLTRADLSASLRPNGKPDMQMYEDALKLREKFEKESTEEEKHQVKKFDLVTGIDIMKVLNIPAGPEVGKIKSEIEAQYLDGKINSRGDAMKKLESYQQSLDIN